MNKQLNRKLYGMRKENLQILIEGAKDYAMYKGKIKVSDLMYLRIPGIGMRDSGLSRDARVHLPFCLIPCEFPREWFEYVCSLQSAINLVLHKVAHSKDILKECLSSTIETDEFTRNIFNIFESVFDSQSKQPSLGLIRSDYLLSCDLNGKTNGIKQVENNTIAAGLGGISPMLRDLYRLILEKLEWKDFYDNLPQNKSCEEMSKALISAWHLYGKQNTVFLFVVEEETFNIYDQRLLEYKILEYDRRMEVLRCTFRDLRTKLVVEDKKLYVNDKEVAVVYFRVGYAPKHYEPEDWTSRLLIEQSVAIKCPSVGLHLAGTKKVQLYLTQEGVLEKFVEPKIAEKLRKVFTNQYALDMMDNKNEIISKAINNPDLFVLKPEREGGGNNLYGLDIATFLKSAKSEKNKSYILMDRIKSPEERNCIVRNDRIPEICLVHSELGIFGVILGNKDDIFRNETVGHLIRSKPVKFNEGGVASGCGALNYPYLV